MRRESKIALWSAISGLVAGGILFGGAIRFQTESERTRVQSHLQKAIRFADIAVISSNTEQRTEAVNVTRHHLTEAYFEYRR